MCTTACQQVYFYMVFTICLQAKVYVACYGFLFVGLDQAQFFSRKCRTELQTITNENTTVYHKTKNKLKQVNIRKLINEN